MFSEIVFVWLYVRIIYSVLSYCHIHNFLYNIYLYICQDGGAVGSVGFYSLCLHLRSHLTKWEVLQNTSS